MSATSSTEDNTTIFDSTYSVGNDTIQRDDTIAASTSQADSTPNTTSDSTSQAADMYEEVYHEPCPEIESCMLYVCVKLYCTTTCNTLTSNSSSGL